MAPYHLPSDTPMTVGASMKSIHAGHHRPRTILRRATRTAPMITTIVTRAGNRAA